MPKTVKDLLFSDFPGKPAFDSRFIISIQDDIPFPVDADLRVNKRGNVYNFPANPKYRAIDFSRTLSILPYEMNRWDPFRVMLYSEKFVVAQVRKACEENPRIMGDGSWDIVRDAPLYLECGCVLRIPQKLILNYLSNPIPEDPSYQWLAGIFYKTDQRLGK